MTADDETHDHYTELIRKAASPIYGRITYQLPTFTFKGAHPIK
jgi:hypothetical protein